MASDIDVIDFIMESDCGGFNHEDATILEAFR
jgi:hypothetical protein